MPRSKRVLRYMAGVVEYEVTDETHWAQMVGKALIRCDNEAKETGCGLVSQFNGSIGWRKYRSWTDAAGVTFGPPDLWIEDHHIETYVTEQDVT